MPQSFLRPPPILWESPDLSTSLPWSQVLCSVLFIAKIPICHYVLKNNPKPTPPVVSVSPTGLEAPWGRVLSVLLIAHLVQGLACSRCSINSCPCCGATARRGLLPQIPVCQACLGGNGALLIRRPGPPALLCIKE